jgi:hypothetical protein
MRGTEGIAFASRNDRDWAQTRKRVSWRAFIPDVEVSHQAPSLDRSQVRKIYARLSASLVWISPRATHLRRISRGAAVRIRLMREDRERGKLDLAEGRSQ